MKFLEWLSADLANFFSLVGLIIVVTIVLMVIIGAISNVSGWCTP